MSTIDQTPIHGAFVIRPPMFKDQRGAFSKPFNAELLKMAGSDLQIKEAFYSVSSLNVIRGMHFQTPPFENKKLVFVVAGKALDVIVDLRKGSPTFGKFFSVELCSKIGNALHIPVGCAHGFKALEEGTIMTYLQTSIYDAQCDQGIAFDSFGMDWGLDSPIISNRDRTFPALSDFKSPFNI